MNLPTHPTHKRVVIIEEAPAWEECTMLGCDNGTVNLPHITLRDCEICNGTGGKWGDMVTVCDVLEDAYINFGNNKLQDIVTKSTILVKEWKPCTGGTTEISCQGDICWNCNGTYAEPDSQSEWRIK